MLWRLERSMYGTRDAPLIRKAEVMAAMESLGFTASWVSPCAYFHVERDLVVITHVDDFLCSGPKEQLHWMKTALRDKHELKGTLIGPGPADDKELSFLNRSIRWTSGGLTYEADTKHVRSLLEEWAMDGCRTVGTLGCKDEEKYPTEKPLTDQEA